MSHRCLFTCLRYRGVVSWKSPLPGGGQHRSTLSDLQYLGRTDGGEVAFGVQEVQGYGF